VTFLSRIQPGARLYDRRTGRERLVQAVESRGRVVFLSFKHPQTGAIDRQPFSLAELEDRFEILSAVVDRLRLGPVSLYAQALVLPLPPDALQRAEEIALAEVRRREKAEGSEIVEDVSAPHLKAGFDLKVLRTDGSVRYVEVKGRSGTQAVELTANEWAQAANHRDRYWLYVVYDCDTVPRLYRVPDPFGRLLARAAGAVRIKASDVMAAAAPAPSARLDIPR